MAMNSSLFRQKLQIYEFPPDCESPYQRWGLQQDCISTSPTCLIVALFSFADGKKLYSWFSCFFFFSQREFSTYSCRFSVSVREGEFKIFLHYHLRPPLKKKKKKNLKNVSSSGTDCNILVHHLQKQKFLIAIYIFNNPNKCKLF